MGWREAVPSWSVRPALHMLSSNGICREITATAGKRWAATKCIFSNILLIFVGFSLKCILIPYKAQYKLPEVLNWLELYRQGLGADEHFHRWTWKMSFGRIHIGGGGPSTVFHFIVLLCCHGEMEVYNAVWHIWKMTLVQHFSDYLLTRWSDSGCDWMMPDFSHRPPTALRHRERTHKGELWKKALYYDL